MKIFNVFTGLIITSIVLLSCQKQQPVTATISGQIEQLKGDSIFLHYYHNDYLEPKQTISALVSAEGSFSLEVPVTAYKEFQIQFSEKGIIRRYILKPGWQSELYVKLTDTETIDTVYFMKDGSVENTIRQEIEPQFWAAYKFMKLAPEIYQHKLDSLEALMNDIVEKHLVDSQTADLQVVENIRQEIKYCKLDRFVGYARRYSRGKSESVETKLKDKIERIFRELDFDNSELLNCGFYKSILEDMINYRLNDKIDFTEIGELYKKEPGLFRKVVADMRLKENLNTIDSLIQAPQIKDYMYYHIFLRNMSIPAIESLKELYDNKFTEVVKDSAKQAYVQQEIQKLEALSPGYPAPQFTYVDINNNSVSMEEFRGKYMYMDIWATWCGPCIMESPYFKKLSEKYGDQIAFVGISVDPDKEKWAVYVKEKELVGIQLYAGKNFDSDIIKKYSIKGIPRFIMIDPQGNIITSDAPRPSNEKTEEIMQNWLKEADVIL